MATPSTGRSLRVRAFLVRYSGQPGGDFEQIMNSDTAGLAPIVFSIVVDPATARLLAPKKVKGDDDGGWCRSRDLELRLGKIFGAALAGRGQA